MEKKSYTIKGYEFTQSTLTPKQNMDLISTLNDKNIVIVLFKKISDYVELMTQHNEDGADLIDVRNLINIVLEYIGELGKGAEDLIYGLVAIAISPESEVFYNEQSISSLIDRNNHVNKNYSELIPFLKAYLSDDILEEIILDFFTFAKGSKFMSRIWGLVKKLNLQEAFGGRMSTENG